MSNPSTDPFNELAARLNPKQNGDVCCPMPGHEHGDKNRSATLSRGNNGKALFCCHRFPKEHSYPALCMALGLPGLARAGTTGTTGAGPSPVAPIEFEYFGWDWDDLTAPRYRPIDSITDGDPAFSGNATPAISTTGAWKEYDDIVDDSRRHDWVSSWRILAGTDAPFYIEDRIYELACKVVREGHGNEYIRRVLEEDLITSPDAPDGMAEQDSRTPTAAAKGIVANIILSLAKPTLKPQRIAALPGQTDHPTCDPTGKVLAIHRRIDHGKVGDKDGPFWYHPDGMTRGLPEGIKTEDLLYGVEKLAQKPDAIVVGFEGERCAAAVNALVEKIDELIDWPSGNAVPWDEVERLNVVAVATVGGSGVCPTAAALAPLRGREVALSPDHAPDGRRHMREIAWVLDQPILWLQFPASAPKGYDVADLLEPPMREGRWAEAARLLHKMIDEGMTVHIHADPQDVSDPLGETTEPKHAEKPAENIGCFGVSPTEGTVGGEKKEPSIWDQVVARMAAIPVAEYETKRTPEAKKLNVRVSALDDAVREARKATAASGGQGNVVDLCRPKPWDQPVSGEELLDELVYILKRFLIMPPHAHEAVALWIVFAHAFDAFSYSARLLANSPTPECGKTTLLKIVFRLTPSALLASNISAASIYRTIQAFGPTLIIDEADTFLTARDGNHELRGIIDSGQDREGAFVVRTEKIEDKIVPSKFSTCARWCSEESAISQRRFLRALFRFRWSGNSHRKKLTNSKSEGLGMNLRCWPAGAHAGRRITSMRCKTPTSPRFLKG